MVVPKIRGCRVPVMWLLFIFEDVCYYLAHYDAKQHATEETHVLNLDHTHSCFRKLQVSESPITLTHEYIILHQHYVVNKNFANLEKFLFLYSCCFWRHYPFSVFGLPLRCSPLTYFTICYSRSRARQLNSCVDCICVSATMPF